MTRAPRLGEASLAARALMRAPAGRRGWRLARMWAERRAAAAHLARTGRPHPLWGDGSLAAVACRRVRAAEPDLGSRDYRLCLAMVILLIALDFPEISEPRAGADPHIGRAPTL